MLDSELNKKEEMVISYKWTANELITGQKYHSRHQCRLVFRVLLKAFIVIFILFSLYVIVFDEVKIAFVLIGLAGLYFLFLDSYFVRSSYRRQLAKRPDQNIDIEWNISPDVLRDKSSLGSGESTWNAISKVVVSPE